MRAKRPRWLRAAAHLFRLSARLMPKPFRERFGWESEEAFDRLVEDALDRKGSRAAVTTAAAACGDIARAGMAERTSRVAPRAAGRRPRGRCRAIDPRLPPRAAARVVAHADPRARGRPDGGGPGGAVWDRPRAASLSGCGSPRRDRHSGRRRRLLLLLARLLRRRFSCRGRVRRHRRLLSDRADAVVRRTTRADPGRTRDRRAADESRRALRRRTRPAPRRDRRGGGDERVRDREVRRRERRTRSRP